ncbi:hypothetical protein HBI26_121350 [Parastagonospora nodorum]|nr:hypothetical protein HBI26_121350 [Parastagonospora nodorum]
MSTSAANAELVGADNTLVDNSPRPTRTTRDDAESSQTIFSKTIGAKITSGPLSYVAHMRLSNHSLKRSMSLMAMLIISAK